MGDHSFAADESQLVVGSLVSIIWAMLGETGHATLPPKLVDVAAETLSPFSATDSLLHQLSEDTCDSVRIAVVELRSWPSGHGHVLQG
jgi:hypothetical protein